jgi:uncharacterized protein YlzI (FlbEa/FlbD family)
MLIESDTEAALHSGNGFVVKEYTQEEIKRVVSKYTDTSNNPSLDKDLVNIVPT